jgi:mono/diheme cytochrome c family protein
MRCVRGRNRGDRRYWTYLFAACMLAACADAGVAQNGSRSTMTGVYTEAQANRGRDTFAGMCQACHSPESHTGAVFMASWGGRSLWELFDYISFNMPKSDPGTLSREEVAQVLAYLLKMNGMPAGSAELLADSAVLKAIRLDTVAARPAGTRWKQD